MPIMHLQLPLIQLIQMLASGELKHNGPKVRKNLYLFLDAKTMETDHPND